MIVQTNVSPGTKSMIQTTRIIAVGALLLWSMTVAAQEQVHFPSFEDNGPGRSSTVLNGYLSRPTGEGQHPTVIFLHGCGGVLMGSMIEPGESDWAGELTRRGYAVLMVDSFAPRDRRQMCAPRTFDLELYRNRARRRLWGVVVSAGATFCSARSHWRNGLVAGQWRSSLRDRNEKL